MSQFDTIYAPLQSVWNGSGAVPTGYTGNPFAGAADTPANKLTAINSWVATTGATYALVPGQKVLNACAPGDLAALSATALQQLQIITGATGGVDSTPGSNQATALANIFAGKTTTLTALGALQTAAKTAASWWQQNGLPWAPTIWDAVAAGLAANPNVAPAPALYVYQIANPRSTGLALAVDIQYLPADAAGNPTGAAVTSETQLSASLAKSDVMMVALRRIVTGLLPRDTALAALSA